MFCYFFTIQQCNKDNVYNLMNIFLSRLKLATIAIYQSQNIIRKNVLITKSYLSVSSLHSPNQYVLEYDRKLVFMIGFCNLEKYLKNLNLSSFLKLSPSDIYPELH